MWLVPFPRRNEHSISQCCQLTWHSRSNLAHTNTQYQQRRGQGLTSTNNYAMTSLLLTLFIFAQIQIKTNRYQYRESCCLFHLRATLSQASKNEDIFSSKLACQLRGLSHNLVYTNPQDWREDKIPFSSCFRGQIHEPSWTLCLLRHVDSWNSQSLEDSSKTTIEDCWLLMPLRDILSFWKIKG